MPSYTMSCFKIPLSLSKQIQSALTRFWWDSKPDKKKLCWVSWDRLTLPKSAGGLGFREIETFNDALLAKLSWRILSEPHSLLAQTLLGKYCHSSSFMECKPPSAPSHGWRGILAGREVLRRGLGWVIGDGADIPVWNSSWLSTEKPVAPIGPPNENQTHLRVKDLLYQHSSRWNLAAIRLHLPQYEDSIRKLIPNDFEMKDELVWLPEKSGVYSTKTGYALSKVNTAIPEVPPFNWNQCIWNVKTLPKLKNFLWKMKTRALPVGETLAMRGIAVDNSCKRCGAMEDELHILLHCPFANRVWEQIAVLQKPDPSTTSSMSLLLQSNKRMINLPPTGLATTPLYPWVYWNLWTSRNQLLFENKKYTEQEVATKATRDARLWHLAQEEKARPRVNHLTSKSRMVPLIPSALSCFVAAAWDMMSDTCGLGWTLRDESGCYLHQNSTSRSCVGSALAVETLAMKAALMEALSSGIRVLNCFSDSKNLITLLTANGNSVELQGILHDIRVLSSSFISIFFNFVPRLENVVADSIAKSALYRFQSAHPLGE
ncbi:unnamed protein product [Microthlaspi erraticum]|uniref:RNase H type-1 domain-containing protein n=1 Tax=Microthlaspi erraticum TaxID=1685480 RepID=A0A6D2HNQ2_9BRAS|nr:unnamed protein product [Microthlaspi erraticum]